MAALSDKGVLTDAPERQAELGGDSPVRVRMLALPDVQEWHHIRLGEIIEPKIPRAVDYDARN